MAHNTDQLFIINSMIHAFLFSGVPILTEEFGLPPNTFAVVHNCHLLPMRTLTQEIKAWQSQVA